MGVFGPKYPRPLQEVVSHAERFCELLARLQPPRTESARVWLIDRAPEGIELVVELSVGDWTRGERSLEAATRSLAEYLLALHAAAREQFGLQGDLECCEDEIFLTLPAGPEAETRIVHPSREEGCPSPDTWFEPGAVVREVYGPDVAAGSGDDEEAEPIRARGRGGERREP